MADSLAIPRTRGVPYLRLIREPQGTLAPKRVTISTPADAYRLLAPDYERETVEVFKVVFLNTQNVTIGCEEVTRGILNSSLIHPREAFRLAIVAGASGIIVAHNHPSGHPQPSADDRAVTRQLVEAGRVLDIPVYDHVIVAGDRYFSFAEAGLL